MGNSNSTEQRAAASIRAIEKQRDSLAEKQRDHLQSASQFKNAAATAKASRNMPLCLSYLRRCKQAETQASTIAGIINGLDVHRNSLEAKMITSETMKVMKQTANTLARDTIDTSNVDDLMLTNEEHSDDVMTIASAMSGQRAFDDEELLAMLDDVAADASAPISAGEMPQMPVETISVNCDQSFELSLESQITKLMLPKTPSHSLEDGPSQPPPAYGASTPAHAINL